MVNPNISPPVSPVIPGLSTDHESWGKYLGCYSETEVDGVPQKNGHASIEITDGQIWGKVYDIASGNPIPAITITLNRRGDNSEFYPVDVSIFTDRGHFTSDRNGDHYRFNGQVEDSLTGSLEKLTFHSSVDFKTLEDGTLQVNFTRSVDGTDRPDLYDAKASALLVPNGCSQQ